MNKDSQPDSSAAKESAGGPPSAALGGEGVRSPMGPENANQSTRSEKISAKGFTGIAVSKFAKRGRGRPKGSKSAPKKAGNAVPLAKEGQSAAFPSIDYDKLAEALLRAQKSQMRGNHPEDGPPATIWEGNGVAPKIVIPSNNPVQRILAQLSYPADKEGQVIAMIAANMTPSWDGDNMEVKDSPYPPVHERALLAHMQEYCMTLRAELPKTRLEPKYQLRGGA